MSDFRHLNTVKVGLLFKLVHALRNVIEHFQIMDAPEGPIKTIYTFRLNVYDIARGKYMRTDEIATEGLTHRIVSIVNDVQRALKEEKGESYDAGIIEDSIRYLVGTKLDRLEENLRDMLTSPTSPEFRELERIIEMRRSLTTASRIEEVGQTVPRYDEESIFNGHRAFSPAKLAAMIEYLSSKGQYVYRTSLNKLLFYSDLSFFYLRGVGISGAVYHNRTFGPVADAAEPILKKLVAERRLKIDPRTRTIQSLDNGSQPEQILTEDEIRILDWVNDTYAAMTATEISDLSHHEKAYQNTNTNEPIAYAYARFLKSLPPKTLLES